jgi:hypothetical protein
MQTRDISPALARLFSELVDGAASDGAFVLNPGDVGLLRSLDKLSADDASRAVHHGATIAAHAEHLRYGLSLMNRWVKEGGNPFADAAWDAAWTISRVDDVRWADIRAGLRTETERWLEALRTPREASERELSGTIGSIVHLAYHLGAIRQISREARGPRQEMFKG